MPDHFLEGLPGALSTFGDPESQSKDLSKSGSDDFFRLPASQRTPGCTKEIEGRPERLSFFE
jgi:hypothetical protein